MFDASCRQKRGRLGAGACAGQLYLYSAPSSGRSECRRRLARQARFAIYAPSSELCAREEEEKEKGCWHETRCNVQGSDEEGHRASVTSQTAFTTLFDS